MGLLSGTGGQQHPQRPESDGASSMVNIHDKSAVTQALIPPTKHRGQYIIMEARRKPEEMTNIRNQT